MWAYERLVAVSVFKSQSRIVVQVPFEVVGLVIAGAVQIEQVVAGLVHVERRVDHLQVYNLKLIFDGLGCFIKACVVVSWHQSKQS